MTQSPIPFLELQQVSHRGVSGHALAPIDLVLHQHQKMGIMGETGSGKSSLLKLIAGHLQPDSGQVLMEGKRVPGPWETLLPGYPGIAYLSQHFELRNNYKVFDLLDYANRLTDSAAAAIFDICQISHLLQRKTHQLSGGERQRIALAMLLIGAPKLLLLDEPFSNADLPHKAMMKQVIQSISEQLHITCVLVAHDPADLLSWADSLLLLQNGTVVQRGTPIHLYQHPVNEYAAALTGHYSLLLNSNPLFQHRQLATNEGYQIVRPDQCSITHPSKGITATIESTAFYGAYLLHTLSVAGEQLLITTTDATWRPGMEISINYRAY